MKTLNKIESLTDAQNKAMLEYRAKWLVIGRSTERIKARKYFVDKFELANVHPLHLYPALFWHGDGSPAVPVAVLDLSDREALVKQVAIELAECKEWAYYEKARSLLSSLGIPTAKPKERKEGKSLGLLSGKAGKGKK